MKFSALLCITPYSISILTRRTACQLLGKIRSWFLFPRIPLAFLCVFSSNQWHLYKPSTSNPLVDLFFQRYNATHVCCLPWRVSGLLHHLAMDYSRLVFALMLICSLLEQ
jgi:hypothetical protein